MKFNLKKEFDMQVILRDVRVAFWNGYTPKIVGKDSKEPRYSAAFPIKPASENYKAIKTAIDTVAKEKWEKKAGNILVELAKVGKICFHEGELANSEGEVYEGFEGMYALNAGQSEKKGRPLIIGPRRDANGQFEILTEADGKPYSGCYVNAKIDIWAQDNSYGRRVNAQLKTVQFVRDGDAFGGGAPATSDGFEEVQDEFSSGDIM
jgi:outer membrane protein assembly factor BamB